MPNIADATRDMGMDLESLLNQNDGVASVNTSVAMDAVEVVKSGDAGKSPLEDLIVRKNQGFEVDPTENEVHNVRSIQMRDETIEGVQRELDAMDEMIEKAQMIQVAKPESAVAMASTMEALSEISIDEVREAKNAAETMDLLEENGGSALGVDLGAETALAVDGKGSLAGGLFRVKDDNHSDPAVDPKTKETMNPERQLDREKTIQVIVDKTGYGVDLSFTDEEREKMQKSTQINLVQVETKELKYAKIKAPDEGFMGQIREDLHSTLCATLETPLVGSRIRVRFRGLTYGEYANLALSQDASNVENFNTRCATYYRAMKSTSIGVFATYDDFLKNVAAIDMPMMTYGVYVPTNPDHMDIGVKCKVEGCQNQFRHPFIPSRMLDLQHVSDRFLDIMKKTITVEAGIPAKKYHEESSLITRTRIVLPKSGIKVDLGLISCYDMIHYRLPYLVDAEKLLTEKYPDDVSGIHLLLPSITDTVVGVILTVDEEEVFIDDIVAMADILYNLPYEDYDLLMAIAAQNNADYNYGFVVRNVQCPKCGTKTPIMSVALDSEIFTQLQTQLNTTVNPETLPRL